MCSTIWLKAAPTQPPTTPMNAATKGRGGRVRARSAGRRRAATLAAERARVGGSRTLLRAMASAGSVCPVMHLHVELAEHAEARLHHQCGPSVVVACLCNTFKAIRRW